ncbi:uncharacterized protein TNCV_4059251 [Trichonephila clavipes]|nr:uncharacterized protein TNCV_4059251 [Trichonephila clavipes]
MALNSGSVSRDMVTTPSSRKIFCCSVPLTTMRPPRPIWLNLPLTQKATRGLLATDHVILNHGQVTWTTPELAPPLLTTTPHQREDISALDRFNVHRCPTRRVFSGTGFEPVTKQATVRYLYHSATAAACHRWESWQWRVRWALACPGDKTRWHEQNKWVAWCFM